MNFRMGWVLSVLFLTMLGACASSKKTEAKNDTSELDDEVSLDGQENSDDIVFDEGGKKEPEPVAQPVAEEKPSGTKSAASPSDEETLAFFSDNATRGIALSGIDWDSSLSQENPGVDCELRLRGSSKSSTTYSCVETSDTSAKYRAIVTVNEKNTGSQRTLKKIVIDIFSKNESKRFVTELSEAGFSKKGKTWISRDGQTKAWTRWDAKKKITSLVLEPAR